MGGGSWSAATYTATTRSKIDSGTSFGYTDTMRSKSRHERKAHEDLDPKKVNGPDSPLAGKNIRESRDSTEHPTSTPVALFFDDTGSMGRVPRVLQEKLKLVFGLLQRKGYVEHPQVLIGAYGDGQVDGVPLQVSQFESDNRIDDALDNLFLEGGGGGNFGESQWLAWYYLAHNTATDSFEKREKKGYAFFIGDERSLDPNGAEVQKYIGADEAPAGLTNEKIVAALKEKWEPFVLLINNTTAHYQESEKFYTDLFGKDHVIIIQDEDSIAETIALAIGMAEGVIDLDDGADDLAEEGADAASIAKASAALATFKSGTGAVVASDSPADLDNAEDDAVTRV